MHLFATVTAVSVGMRPKTLSAFEQCLLVLKVGVVFVLTSDS